MFKKIQELSQRSPLQIKPERQNQIESNVFVSFQLKPQQFEV